MNLELLVEAFDKCLESWLVKSFLSVRKTKILQNIKLINGNTQKEREVCEIDLNDEIIIQFKNRQGDFDERHNVSKIQFHAGWEGVKNEGYIYTFDNFHAGVRGVMGAEYAAVKLIAGDGSIIDYFSVICRDNLIDAVVRTILFNMKLSTKIPRALVDLDLLRSILDCLLKYAAWWSFSSKKDVLSLISRLEAIVSDVRE